MTDDQQDAMEDLDRHVAFVRRVALRLAGANDADDLAQDAMFLGLASKRSVAWAAWWVRVCRNLLVDRLRSERRRRTHDEAAAKVEATVDPRFESDHRALLLALTRAMCALSAEHYQIVRMRWFDGLSPTEIAARLDQPLSMVKRRLERALAAMRGRLTNEKPDWRAALPVFLGWVPISGAETAWSASKGAVGAMAVQKKLGVVMSATLVLALGTAVYTFIEGAGDDGSFENVTTAPAASPDSGSQPRRSAMPTPESAPKENADAIPTDDEFFANVDRDLDIFGRVVDEVLQPIAGAKVRSFNYPWRRVSVLNRRGWDESINTGDAVTDLRGRFILRHRRGELVDLEVSAAGFARGSFPRCQAGERCVLTLTRPTPFTILVIDEAAVAVEGAAVHVWRINDRKRGGANVSDDRRGTTGMDGRFAIDDFAAGTIGIGVDHPTLCGADSTRATLSESGQLLTIGLRRGTRVDGRIVDAQTGFGIAGATVMDGWEDLTSAKTDDDGRFTFWLDVEGTIALIRARHPAYATVVEPVPGEGQELVLRLMKNQSAVGRVVDETGTPIGGAMVSALAECDLGIVSVTDAHSTRTTKDGTFRIDGLRPDLEHSYVVQAVGHGRAIFEPAAGPGPLGTRDVGDFTLEAGVLLEGRVVDADGEPLTDVAIRLERSLTSAERNRLSGGRPGLTGHGRTEERRTDDLGRFRFPDLSSGAYSITASKGDVVPVTRRIGWLLGEKPEPIEIRFVDVAPLRVQVVDDTDQPVVGVGVTVTLASGKESVQKRTAEDGAASFDGIEPGQKFSVWISIGRLPYLGERYTTFVRREDRVTIRFERAAAITGRVIHKDGAAAVGYVVRVHPEPSGENGVSDKDGAFRIMERPGRKVRISCDGMRTTALFDLESSRMRGESAEVCAPIDGVQVMILEIDSDQTLTIHVRDKDDRPIRGAMILFSNGSGQPIRRAADESGRVVLEGLLAVESKVTAVSAKNQDGLGAARATVVPNGQEITLRLVPATRIVGTIERADGSAAVGARAEASAEDGGYAAVSDRFGHAVLLLSGAGPFRFTVTFTDADGKEEVGTIEDALPESFTLRLRAKP